MIIFLPLEYLSWNWLNWAILSLLGEFHFGQFDLNFVSMITFIVFLLQFMSGLLFILWIFYLLYWVPNIKLGSL